MFSDHFQLKTQQTSVRSVRKLCKLLAAVSAVLLLSSAAAEASCGGYLYRQGRPVEHSQVHTSATDFLPGAMSHIALSTDRPLDRIPSRPCSGPGCSRTPLPLAPVSVPITLPRTMDSGVLSDLSALSPSSLDGLLEVQSERITNPGPAEVFRPPAA
jgi:hypothetical protein